MKDNNFNIDQYSKFYLDYLDSNLIGNIGGLSPKERALKLVKYLKKNGNIFEIGAASGADAIELSSLGFNVIPSDVVDNFVNILKNKFETAIKFDVLNDSFPKRYDCIYMNAILVHFNHTQANCILNKIQKSLNKDGILYTSILKGEGQERSKRGRGFERDFYYYNDKDFSLMLQKAESSILETSEIDNKWLQYICRTR